MTKAEITIVLPCYNCESSVERAIKSIQSQTFIEFECLVIDDGSSDKTKEIIKKYIEGDERFKFYSFRENRGVSFAKNFGINHASTPLLSFVDSDDYIGANLLKNLLEARKNTGADIIFCDLVEESNYQYRYLFSYNKKAGIITTNDFLRELIKDNKVKSWLNGRLFAKSLFKGKSLEGRMLEDFLVLPDLVMRANYISYVPYTGYHYEIRENSLSRATDYESKFAFLKFAEERKKWVLKNHPQFVSEANVCIANFYNNYFSMAREKKNIKNKFLFERKHVMFVRRQYFSLFFNKNIKWKRKVVISLLYLLSFVLKDKD